MLLTIIERLRKLVGFRPSRRAVSAAVRRYRAWPGGVTRDGMGDPPAPPLNPDGSTNWTITCVGSSQPQIYVWYACWSAWQTRESNRVQYEMADSNYQSWKSQYTTCTGGVPV